MIWPRFDCFMSLTHTVKNFYKSFPLRRYGKNSEIQRNSTLNMKVKKVEVFLLIIGRWTYFLTMQICAKIGASRFSHMLSKLKVSKPNLYGLILCCLRPPKFDQRHLNMKITAQSYVSQYAILKKCVFMARLKADTLVVFLVTAGRAFHSSGPAIESSLFEFCSGTKYVNLACLGRLEPTVAGKPRDSSSCVCDV